MYSTAFRVHLLIRDIHVIRLVYFLKFSRRGRYNLNTILSQCSACQYEGFPFDRDGITFARRVF